MEIQSNAGVLNGKVIAKMNNVGHNSGRVSGPGEAKLQMPSVGPVAEVRSAAVGLRPYMSGETKWGSGELVLQIEYLDADESKFYFVLVGEGNLYFAANCCRYSDLGQKITKESWGRYDVIEIADSAASGGICIFSLKKAERLSRNARPLRVRMEISPICSERALSQLEGRKTQADMVGESDDWEFLENIDEKMKDERQSDEEIGLSIAVLVTSVFFLFKVMGVNVTKALLNMTTLGNPIK